MHCANLGTRRRTVFPFLTATELSASSICWSRDVVVDDLLHPKPLASKPNGAWNPSLFDIRVQRARSDS